MNPPPTAHPDLVLLRLIAQEQQRQQARLVKVVRGWADAGRLPSNPAINCPRKDVQAYIQSASGFGWLAENGPSRRLKSTTKGEQPEVYRNGNPYIVFTTTTQRPLLAQTQDLNPNRLGLAKLYPLRFCGLAHGDDLIRNNTKALVDTTRTQVSYYEGESEVTEDLAERFHAPFFFKLLFFILIFDLDMTLISVLAIVFGLYIQGVFEPLLRFFRPRPRDPPRAEELPRDAHPQPVGSNNEVTERAEGSSHETPARDRENDGPAEDPRHRSVLRALYQSVGMFVGTLLPWWTPDDRYIV